MICFIGDKKVCVFKATGIEVGVFAAVPLKMLMTDGSLNKKAYIEEGWASANNAFQKIPRGSHVWPDLAVLAEETDQAAKDFVLAIGGKR